MHRLSIMFNPPFDGHPVSKNKIGRDTLTGHSADLKSLLDFANDAQGVQTFSPWALIKLTLQRVNLIRAFGVSRAPDAPVLRGDGLSGPIF